MICKVYGENFNIVEFKGFDFPLNHQFKNFGVLDINQDILIKNQDFC